MLELPEVRTISGQMNAELVGRTVFAAEAGASPHKFAFMNHPPARYPELLCGRTIRAVTDDGGNRIYAALDDGSTLFLGDMGGRIMFLRPGDRPPSRHQLLLAFADGSGLAVSIALWGAIQVLASGGHPTFTHSPERISPLGPEFTLERFERTIANRVEPETLFVKALMIQKPGLDGLGNGCLQDILFRARVHPRRRVKSLSLDEQRAIYDATLATLRAMVAQHGRDSEYDLYGQPGAYHCILSSQTAGRPCPVCATPIEKIAFLGGASYFCPQCQPL